MKQLRLFLNADGFLREGGRIHNVQLEESARFPYLLPPNHPFTALIVHEIHRRQFHSGVNVVVTMLLQINILDNLNSTVCKEASSSMCDLSEAARNSLQSSRYCTLT